jgi:NAD(P) transhydrogenase subunit alpha
MSPAFIKAEMDLFAAQARDVDIIITTALIPGKPAPKLISEDMVKSMRQGSVIVDMAAEQGGNCELTVPGEVVVRHGVTIIGYKDLPSRLPKQASTLYANNLLRLTEDLVKTKSIDGDRIAIDMQDEVLRGTTVINSGEVTWPPPAPKLSAAPPAAAAKPAAAMPPRPKAHGEPSGPMSPTRTAVLFGVGALLFLLIGRYAPPAFLGHLTVFVLACFVGYMVVWNVKPALHTPLMSVTNAVSSIIAIGALVQFAPDLTKISTDLARPGEWIRWLSVVAIALATINMFGGFAVTQRMLAMFRK